MRRKIAGIGPLASANGVTHVAYRKSKADVDNTFVRCMVADSTTLEFIKYVQNVNKTF